MLKVLTLLFVISIVAIGAPDEDTSCTHDDKTFRCVRYLSNYDGDTVRFEIPGVHAILGKNIPVRIAGIDTPEVKTKDRCEKEQARKAKELVASKLRVAKRIDLENCGREKYFRLLCTILADGKSVAEELLTQQLAYPYQGGTKQNINWCQIPKNPRIPAQKPNKK